MRASCHSEPVLAGAVDGSGDDVPAATVLERARSLSAPQAPQESGLAPGEDYEEWRARHPCLLANFDEFERQLRGRRLAVFLDYDGTLTPIVSNPDAAVLSDEMRGAVRAVAGMFPTAIISGRGREKVEAFVRLPELYYAGSHGMDIVGPRGCGGGGGGGGGDLGGHGDGDGDGGCTPCSEQQQQQQQPSADCYGSSNCAAAIAVAAAPSASAAAAAGGGEGSGSGGGGGGGPTHGHSHSHSHGHGHHRSAGGGGGGEPFRFQAAAEYAPLVDAVYARLRERLAPIPGASVEHNKFCVSAHFRNCHPDSWQRVVAAVDAVVAAEGNGRLHVTRGRKVLEVRPCVDWDKGAALLHLLDALGLAGRGDVTALYLGDDATDEDAFAALKGASAGAGVLVSTVAKPTAAAFTLRDPGEVLQLLRLLLRYGEGDGNGWRAAGARANGWAPRALAPTAGQAAGANGQQQPPLQQQQQQQQQCVHSAQNSSPDSAATAAAAEQKHAAHHAPHMLQQQQQQQQHAPMA